MDYTFLRPKRVHEALAGHPDQPSLRTVTRWCEGFPVPAWADEIVRARLGVARVDESPPAWAEGLADRTALKVIGALASPEVLAAIPEAIAALEALAPPEPTVTPEAVAAPEAPPQQWPGSPRANGGRQDQVGSKR